MGKFVYLSTVGFICAAFAAASSPGEPQRGGGFQSAGQGRGGLQSADQRGGGFQAADQRGGGFQAAGQGGGGLQSAGRSNIASRVIFDAPGHAAPEGAAVAASGGEPGAAWRLLDWRSRDTGVSGIFDASGEATLPQLPAGYYRLVAGEPPAPRQTLATLAVVSPPEGREGDSFFAADCAASYIAPGAFDCPWNGGDAIRTIADLAALAGIRHVRDRMRWRDAQPSPDAPPDFSRCLAAADLFAERGIAISGCFHDSPPWAGRLQKLPGDLAALYRFCADTAAAFDGRMEDWEFWNEPDIHFAPEPVWDYAAALKAAYLGFKSARPDIPVLNGALCQPPGSAYQRELFANGVAQYFDIFNYHTYAALSLIPEIFSKLRETLAAVGAEGRPVWITECGTNNEGPATEPSVRPAFTAHSPEQELVVAEHYAKANIALQMEGVVRNYTFILGAYSERGGKKDWGLLRRDGTVKPSYAALATQIRELGDARLLGRIDAPAGIRAYLYEQPDGSQTVAYWAESPLDDASSNTTLVDAEPDCAREWVLQPPAPAGGTIRVSDMCGGISAAKQDASGALHLPATRFPAYVSGLHGLAAVEVLHSDLQNSDAVALEKRAQSGPTAQSAVDCGAATVEVLHSDLQNSDAVALEKRAQSGPTAQTRPAAQYPGAVADHGAVLHKSIANQSLHKSFANQSLPSPIIFRVDLAPSDFEIGAQKTLAVAKVDEPRLRVQVWNLSETAATGTVAAAGVALAGLPAGTVEIAPFDKVEFECALRADEVGARASGAPGDPSPYATLVLSGSFNGRQTSPLSMPVIFERLLIGSCETVELPWRDPAAWVRNDSAATYTASWDETEQAVRFDAEWSDPAIDRWLYPVLPLSGSAGGSPAGLLSGAVRAVFEVKSAQDKVENDFKYGGSNFMLVRKGGKGGPEDFFPYAPPTGSWERRYVELAAATDGLDDVEAVRLGCNPRGMRLTFWVRNVRILTTDSKP